MRDDDRDAGFSIVVFPFLKTSEPVQLGGITFRSTDDVENLPREQATAVRDVAQMLFFRDDYRVKSATYAVVPRIDTDVRPPLDAAFRHDRDARGHAFHETSRGSEKPAKRAACGASPSTLIWKPSR